MKTFKYFVLLPNTHMRKNNLILSYILSLVVLFSLFTEHIQIVQAGKYALLVMVSLYLIAMTNKDRRKTFMHTYNFVFATILFLGITITLAMEGEFSLTVLLGLHVIALIGLIYSMIYKEYRRKKHRRQRQTPVKARKIQLQDTTSKKGRAKKTTQQKVRVNEGPTRPVKVVKNTKKTSKIAVKKKKKS